MPGQPAHAALSSSVSSLCVQRVCPKVSRTGQGRAAPLQRINVGTLDAHARRDLDHHGPTVAARVQLDDMSWMPAPRSWWRTASTPGGELVGLVVPSRNYEFPVIGYIGVVPEQRGHGYVDDLLAEGTAVLARPRGPM